VNNISANIFFPNTKKLAALCILTVLIFNQSIVSAQTISGNDSPKALVSSGGSDSGGQGVQADLFSGAATYHVALPVPPGPGGIKPNIALDYNSQRKNANSWVGYGWELELGAIERAPEEETGRIDYVNGTKFMVKLAGQSLTLVRTETDVITCRKTIARRKVQKFNFA